MSTDIWNTGPDDQRRTDIGWGDVAADRNQKDISDYDREPQSIWDWHNQQDYAQHQNDRQDQQDDARDSWGGADSWSEAPVEDVYTDDKPARRGGPGSRGGTPAAFKHGQQSRTWPGGIDERQAKKKINAARHPINTSKKKIKRKAKKSSWWPGSQSHTFHNPNAQR